MAYHHCGYCGSASHNIELCPKTAGGQSARRNLRCSYCGKTDHSVEACPHTYAGSAARTSHPSSVADFFVLDKDQ